MYNVRFNLDIVYNVHIFYRHVGTKFTPFRPMFFVLMTLNGFITSILIIQHLIYWQFTVFSKP